MLLISQLIDEFAIIDKSPTTLLTLRCCAMPFPARALKKQFIDVDIVVKNKWKCGLLWSVLLSTTSTCDYSFPKHFFSCCSCLLSKFAKVFERKVWRVQVAHLHNAAWAPSIFFRGKFSLELKWFLSTFSTIFTSYLWRVSFRTLWRVWYSSEWHFLSLN